EALVWRAHFPETHHAGAIAIDVCLEIFPISAVAFRGAGPIAVIAPPIHLAVGLDGDAEYFIALVCSSSAARALRASRIVWISLGCGSWWSGGGRIEKLWRRHGCLVWAGRGGTRRHDLRHRGFA